jgi:Histidine kinase
MATTDSWWRRVGLVAWTGPRCSRWPSEPSYSATSIRRCRRHRGADHRKHVAMGAVPPAHCQARAAPAARAGSLAGDRDRAHAGRARTRPSSTWSSTRRSTRSWRRWRSRWCPASPARRSSTCSAMSRWPASRTPWDTGTSSPSGGPLDTELERELLRARLDAVAARLRPHFLFHALHSVAALVRSGETQAAVRAVASLSSLLRATLETTWKSVGFEPSRPINNRPWRC